MFKLLVSLYKSFPDFLERLHDNDYPSFCDVARSASEICLQRPFYPASAKAGVKQEHLYKALVSKLPMLEKRLVIVSWIILQAQDMAQLSAHH